MTLVAVGASHRTTGLAGLDRFARALARLRAEVASSSTALSHLRARELVFLSTCHRVEVYVVPEDGHATRCIETIRAAVFPVAGGSGSDDVVYVHRDADAVHHLCRVAAGLDSMVLGEPEVSGQVRRAFHDAIPRSNRGPVLRDIAALARTASRRVRSETDLAKHSVSLGSVAMQLVAEELGSLEGRHALMVGAGRVGTLVSKLMSRLEFASLTATSRSPGPLRALADRVACDTAPVEALPELLGLADVVVTATSSTSVVLDRDLVAAGARKRRRGDPLCIVDLGLPADVSDEVRRLDSVRLFNLTDVQHRLERQVGLRLQAVAPAEAIVEEIVRPPIGVPSGGRRRPGVGVPGPLRVVESTRSGRAR